jgi:YrbI family 3-deoxy-D-manno-octulosonate 8-phosphate phosphatase
VQALVIDVQGSLTDGLVAPAAEGGDRGRLRDHDVVGLQLAQAAGWTVILMAEAASPALADWAARLGITHLAIGGDKRAALAALAGSLKLDLATAACLGDDLLDLPAMDLCGLAVAPRDAVVLVREKVDAVLEMPAGRGAVRELVDRVLAAQDRTCEAIGAYLQACGGVSAGETLAVADEAVLRPKIGFRG